MPLDVINIARLQSSSRNIQIKTAIIGFARGARAAIPDHFSLHLIALGTLMMSLIAIDRTGVSIDYAIILQFGYYLLNAAAFLALGLITIKFYQLAFIEKSRSPTIELIKHLAISFNNPPKLVNTLHLFIVFAVFATAFSMLRSSIAVLNPFSWDVLFHDIDKAIHFGYLPHEWLGWLINSPLSIGFINLVYNTWYFVMLGSVFAAGMVTEFPRLRLQFLNAFFLTWLGLGFFMATGFSSAGPCFFAPLGLGNAYSELMNALNVANESVPIWALPIQDLLWEGYIGARDGSAGITAFPSIHVATSVLIAIAGSKVNRYLGLGLWIYTALIMVGSVALGWHYAVDGYASAAMVPIIWWFAGKIADRSLVAADKPFTVLLPRKGK